MKQKLVETETPESMRSSDSPSTNDQGMLTSHMKKNMEFMIIEGVEDRQQEKLLCELLLVQLLEKF